MKPLVYLDTSVPSYYYEERDDPLVRSRHLITVRWWETQRSFYNTCLSEAVLDELRQGDYPNKPKVLALVKDVEILPIEREVLDIVKVYINHKLMPQGIPGDAVHLAVASLRKADFLLTWNCKNLANANKRRHIHLINGDLGLSTPEIVTPDLLFLEEGIDHG